PVPRDDENPDLDLAGRERAALVEIGADMLHAGRDGRRMDPHLVRPEDAPAPGGELVEHGLLLVAELLGREVDEAVHGGGSPCGDARRPQGTKRNAAAASTRTSPDPIVNSSAAPRRLSARRGRAAPAARRCAAGCRGCAPARP